jgi:A/G-specific adenine glycosylase
VPTRRTVFAIVCTPRQELLLERRPGSGIWGGLWCFPEFAGADEARLYCESQLASEVIDVQPLRLLRHSFSHYHLEINPLLITLSRAPGIIRDGERLNYWPAQDMPAVGIAAPVKRLWQDVARVLGSQPANP